MCHCLQFSATTIPDSLSWSNIFQAELLQNRPGGDARKLQTPALLRALPAHPASLTLELRSSMNWRSSSRRQSPPGWCLGRAILGPRARGGERGGAGSRRRRGERAQRRVALASGARRRGEQRRAQISRRSPALAAGRPRDSMDVRSQAQPYFHLDGGLHGLRWGGLQCVGQWEAAASGNDARGSLGVGSF